MKTIKVSFNGWWDSFDAHQNLIFNILSKHYNVELCSADRANYSICSLYKKDFISASGVRIFYTAEAVSADYTLFDYFIGFDNMEFGDRYIMVPNYIMNMKYQNSKKMMIIKALLSYPDEICLSM